MSCQKCGREDGHWVGCEAASGGTQPPGVPPEAAEKDGCEHGKCSNAKRPAQGKGPKPKYCDDHSTPKSRKA
ncbi:hypothetical protein ACIO1C_29710 [Streptomyces sp. NPDC087420]|uniref:hypothetical protein n=1 Tax=Streptomyces sp. NPDC087420 TaxID=3365785 RepID=UPI003832E45F